MAKENQPLDPGSAISKGVVNLAVEWVYTVTRSSVCPMIGADVRGSGPCKYFHVSTINK